MDEQVMRFYDDLASSYHLMFEDWEQSIARQQLVLTGLLEAEGVARGSEVLDCACGIGTQALGLADAGYKVWGSDFSAAAVKRAEAEATRRGLEARWCVADMRSLENLPDGAFAVVVAMDNPLPHLALDELAQAATAIRRKLRPEGVFITSIRDYDLFMEQRPAMQPPLFCGVPGRRRIIHQVWDWIDERSYVPHLYITEETAAGWTVHHQAGIYHPIRREELSGLLRAGGFTQVRWMMPDESGFYQPVVVARV